MKNFRDRIIPESSSVDNRDIELYTKYLYNKSFRGFYYDTDEKSYGIVLRFSPVHPESLTLYAQESKAGSTIFEYTIHSKLFLIEQMAYDKVLVSAVSCEKSASFKSSGKIS